MARRLSNDQNHHWEKMDNLLLSRPGAQTCCMHSCTTYPLTSQGILQSAGLDFLSMWMRLGDTGCCKFLEQHYGHYPPSLSFLTRSRRWNWKPHQNRNRMPLRLHSPAYVKEPAQCIGINSRNRREDRPRLWLPFSVMTWILTDALEFTQSRRSKFWCERRTKRRDSSKHWL